MEAVIYARTATRTQTQHGNSIQAQIEVCTKYAKENGYEVNEVFIDAGYSGLKLDRPGLDKMHELLARNSIHAVVVSDISRLTRSAKDKSCLERVYADRGVELRCVAKNVSNVAAQSFPVRGNQRKKSPAQKK